MSYSQRYQEMLKRFIGDNIYQAGWFITTKTDDAGRVSYTEPLATASGKAFPRCRAGARELRSQRSRLRTSVNVGAPRGAWR